MSRYRSSCCEIAGFTFSLPVVVKLVFASEHQQNKTKTSQQKSLIANLLTNTLILSSAAFLILFSF